MTDRIVLTAPAKINLYLQITGMRRDGYHLLDTVMQAVDLRDLLVISRSSQPGIGLTCNREVAEEPDDNLAYRAAEQFCRQLHMDPCVHIHIDKRIPMGAGLGGGSADAAAVLVGLNRFLDAGLDGDRLREMSLGLGADVPFAVTGGCARAQGIGEALTAIQPGLADCTLVIAKPDLHQSTREAYNLFDRMGGGVTGKPVDAMLQALAYGGLAEVGKAMFNAFETAYEKSAVPLASVVDDIKYTLLDGGARGALLSGSGSAVVGLFQDREAAAECARRVACLEHVETHLAAPCTHGPEIVWLD